MDLPTVDVRARVIMRSIIWHGFRSTVLMRQFTTFIKGGLHSVSLDLVLVLVAAACLIVLLAVSL